MDCSIVFYGNQPTLVGHTVDEKILHHLTCMKPYKQWDKLPTSTGDRRISEPSTVVNVLCVEYVFYGFTKSTIIFWAAFLLSAKLTTKLFQHQHLQKASGIAGNRNANEGYIYIYT